MQPFIVHSSKQLDPLYSSTECVNALSGYVVWFIA